jgi:diazepam-binding inhibitor (GABA receptor modulating acyl-CoA-binding protein)
MNFEQACVLVKKLKRRPANDELLNLYGLYKQATAGDCKEAEPWMWEVEKKAKWSAWKANAGKQPDQAKKEYTIYVYQLMKIYN